VLSAEEQGAVRIWLRSRHAKLAAALPTTVPQPLTVGEPLVLADNPPPVQLLAPGFTLSELPVSLTNVNNVRFRHDGVLVTLGYNGDIHLLRDTNKDGVEDEAQVFYRNAGSLRGPIGMLLTPPGYARGSGVFVAAKGKVSLIVDTDGDDVADDEIVVASGWQEIAQNVDATGLAMGPDGSLYFGLGTANFANAWLIDESGRASYDIGGVRGTVQRVSPDFAHRETICTGVRFPIAFAFNAAGDLFCTDQEGATWLSNGNPLDELLHIRLDAAAGRVNATGRQHFGFPPRHPRHNPAVIDEPSTYDFGPQHQSTCGMVFNDSVNGGPVFGPAAWGGQALVAGESRGKIWRTQLVPTEDGYVAATTLIACLQLLTVDVCVSPQGDLVVACHSGPPDWGTGPTGPGRLFRIRYADSGLPQPTLAWSEGPRELRIAFDRPVSPVLLAGLAEHVRVEYGEHVRAGDRFETLVPPYAVVRAQQLKPRCRLPVGSAALSADCRTVLLNTEPLPQRGTYAISLPWSGSVAASATAGDLPKQHPQVDVDLQPHGLELRVSDAGNSLDVSRWIPHLDLAVSRKLTAGSQSHDALWSVIGGGAGMRLRTKLDLRSMLRPAVQPGTTLDYEWPAETAVVTFRANRPLQLTAGVARRLLEVQGQHAGEHWVSVFTAPADVSELIDLQIDLAAGSGVPQLTAVWHTNEDSRARPFPLHRFVLPWVSEETVAGAIDGLATAVPELQGGSWGRGRRVFHSDAAGCYRCHAMQGRGAAIGPDLGNLIHRDYASVLRDLQNPGFAINPDYVGQTVVLKDGRVLTGVLQTRGDRMLLGDAQGRQTELRTDEIEQMQPATTSVMPQGIVEKLSAEDLRDLLTYLMTPAPRMPLDSPLSAPPLRTQSEVAAVLAGSRGVDELRPLRPLQIVLVDGVKDHGPGEHDYPAWRTAWQELLSSAEAVNVRVVREFPDDELLATADILVFFQKGSFEDPRPDRMDAFLQRGGGAVYIHWAVNGNDKVRDFAKRIGIASWGGRIAFRHGPLTLDIHNQDHPIVRNYQRLQLYDESYWKLTGDPGDVTLLATSVEDGMATPQMWVRDHQPGRVFVSIPGHYSWTFDDPLFRVLLLRGIAWTANEPVDRFNELVFPGARMSR
jgi:putative heme-binding domain-containing protein